MLILEGEKENKISNSILFFVCVWIHHKSMIYDAFVIIKLYSFFCVFSLRVNSLFQCQKSALSSSFFFHYYYYNKCRKKCLKQATVGVWASVKCMASATIKTAKSNSRKVSRPQIEIKIHFNQYRKKTSFHTRDAYR